MALEGILSTLPHEIRRRVYRYLVSGAHILLTQSWKKVHNKFYGKYSKDGSWEDPLDTHYVEDYEWPARLDNRILRTSHQINAEASALLFQESTFWVSYHIADLNRGLKDLDIGDLEANLHRIRDLTICILEEDGEPEFLASLPQFREKAGEKKKEKQKSTRGITPLFERYAARCTALHRLTIRFDFKQAQSRPREPLTRWRPMLERILRSSVIQKALASFAVKDEVVIKTNIKYPPLYTVEIGKFVGGIAKWKGWESKSEKAKYSVGLGTEGRIEKWVLAPKIKEGDEREEKSKGRIDDEILKEFNKKYKALLENMTK
ncbi:MAG: hypothetical protein Q9195_007758 [Heterodermia aff. obscurata]